MPITFVGSLPPLTTSSGTERLAMRGSRRNPSVHLDVVALLALHLFHEIGPLDPFLLGQLLETLLQAALHALQAAHVDVCLLVFERHPELLGVLHGLMLDPHLPVDQVLLGLLLA